MIELVILEYLKDKLDCPVSMEEMDIDEYVLIKKTGSGFNNLISSTSVTIQSYSDSLYNACLLNEKVKTIMLGLDGRGITELDEVSKCGLNSDYVYTDTTTKHYRYQAVYELVNY